MTLISPTFGMLHRCTGLAPVDILLSRPFPYRKEFLLHLEHIEVMWSNPQCIHTLALCLTLDFGFTLKHKQCIEHYVPTHDTACAAAEGSLILPSVFVRLRSELSRKFVCNEAVCSRCSGKSCLNCLYIVKKSQGRATCRSDRVSIHIFFMFTLDFFSFFFFFASEMDCETI